MRGIVTTAHTNLQLNSCVYAHTSADKIGGASPKEERLKVSPRILSRARTRLRGLLPVQGSPRVSVSAPTPDNTPEARALLDKVGRAPVWMHALDLGHGVVTPGVRPANDLRQAWNSMELPDLRGKSVLDIGAWDGWFSFEAERRGGSRVVALDRYVWALDWEAKRHYRRECNERGLAPEPYTLRPELFNDERLPGKYGFDLAHRIYNSHVEVVVADLMTADLEALGTFDIVLYLGGLYHMEEPLTALLRVRRLAKELAVVETAGLVVVPGREETPLFRFYPPRDKLSGDPSNFWDPNLAGFKACVRPRVQSRPSSDARACRDRRHHRLPPYGPRLRLRRTCQIKL